MNHIGVMHISETISSFGTLISQRVIKLIAGKAVNNALSPLVITYTMPHSKNLFKD